jgi:hypothetical protein
MGKHGVKALAKGLLSNCTLQNLCLMGDNALDDLDGRTVAEAGFARDPAFPPCETDLICAPCRPKGVALPDIESFESQAQWESLENWARFV